VNLPLGNVGKAPFHHFGLMGQPWLHLGALGAAVGDGWWQGRGPNT